MRPWFSKKAPSDKLQVVEDSSSREEGNLKSFWEHLDDLRSTVFKSLIALAVTFHLALAFANRILGILTWPLRRVTDHPENFLLSLNVTDSFMLSVKLAFYVGLVLAAPAILYFVGQFVLPALRPREKQMLWPGFAAGTILFILGAVSCFLFIVPQTLRAFIQASHWLGIEPRWTIESYISFVTQFTLMTGLTFEIPLVLLVLVRLGVLSYATVRSGRKILILVAFVIAAFLAPPDPLSMILMALPLVLLFEITIWLCWLTERRRNT
ncbi:MAG: twin-arginine translocase subunit TatC [Verrucomicrobiia bacterium]